MVLTAGVTAESKILELNSAARGLHTPRRVGDSVAD